jgi:Lon protease-like protein
MLPFALPIFPLPTVVLFPNVFLPLHIFATGCSGLITHVENLEDGKYNLVLRGLEKFSINSEELPAVGRLYRSAVITPLDDSLRDGDRDELRLERRRLQQLLAPLFTEGNLVNQLPDAMPDEDLVNALAQYLEFEPLEKLALLERRGALARARSMVELLEMKQMGSGNGDQGTGLIH